MTPRPRGDHVRSQSEGGHLKAKERVLRRNQICHHLNHGLLASRTVRKYIFVVEATQSVLLCYGSPSKRIHRTYILPCPVLTTPKCHASCSLMYHARPLLAYDLEEEGILHVFVLHVCCVFLFQSSDVRFLPQFSPQS